MAEYIKRETLVHRLKNPYLFNITQRIFEIISEIPAADVAPVVHCKDCEHAFINGFGNESGVVLCKLLSSCENVAQVVRQFDDFCSYGEKKEG